MVGTPEEEKLKDEIFQEIHDTLDKCEWGKGCKRTVLKVVFEGEMNLKAVYFQSEKERSLERILTNFQEGI